MAEVQATLAEKDASILKTTPQAIKKSQYMPSTFIRLGLDLETAQYTRPFKTKYHNLIYTQVQVI
jgi:hypothetical protein